ncbi:hypothetical protein I4U23_012537 [Adineta vaga]|nr:hypothetical protein I4U23_012537 [Adineta vaga]
MKLTALILSFILLLSSCVQGGPAVYGICQAAAAGAVFGTVTAGAGTVPAIVACNAAFGQCSAACAALVLTPTP